MSNHPDPSDDGPSSSRNPTPDEVRAARAAAGLTQEAAAALVFSARRAWQDWEGGQRRMHPGLWELFRIKTAHIAAPR